MGSREEPSYRAAAVSSTRITILPIQSILLILSRLEARLRAKHARFQIRKLDRIYGMGRMDMASERTKRP